MLTMDQDLPYSGTFSLRKSFALAVYALIILQVKLSLTCSNAPMLMPHT